MLPGRTMKAVKHVYYGSGQRGLAEVDGPSSLGYSEHIPILSPSQAVIYTDRSAS
jgi:hypothetical protein